MWYSKERIYIIQKIHNSYVLGQRFAFNTEKTVLAKLLRKFKIKAVDTPETVKIITELILRPAEGMFLRLEPRK